MARSFTVSELETRVRLLGDWQNLESDYSDAGSYMSSGTLYRFMDAANSWAWNVYAHADEGWNAKRYTFTSVAQSASYALPSDFYVARGVEQAIDNSSAPAGWLPLRRADADDDSDVGLTAAQGSTVAYRYIGDWIELVPPPGDARQFRITYVPTAQVISSSLQTVDGVDGYEQVVVLKTVVLGKIREEKPYADVQAELNEHVAQMERNVKRRDR